MQLYGCGRHTHLLIASAELEVALDGVYRLSEFHFLDKLDAVLEVTELHSEHGVHLGNLTTARCKFSDQLDTVFFIDME